MHCIKIRYSMHICSMKVETRHYSYIITASLIGRALILVDMSVETFKNSRSFIVFFHRQHHVADKKPPIYLHIYQTIKEAKNVFG